MTRGDGLSQDGAGKSLQLAVDLEEGTDGKRWGLEMGGEVETKAEGALVRLAWVWVGLGAFYWRAHPSHASYLQGGMTAILTC